MKKVCMYISVLITVCFMLPAIFTNTNKQTSSHVNDVSQSLQSNEENSNFDGEIKQSSDSKEIKLLHSKTGEIENVKLEIICVMFYQQKCLQLLKKKLLRRKQLWQGRILFLK